MSSEPLRISPISCVRAVAGRHQKGKAPMSETKVSGGALAAGGIAAILASTCCLGPLLLVALGFSGAWIGNLTVLEAYRPLFIGVALILLFVAWRRIFRPARGCKPGQVCAMPEVRTAYKSIFWIVVALVFIAFIFPYFMRFFY